MAALQARFRSFIARAAPVAVAILAGLGILQTVFLGGQLVWRDHAWRAEASATAARVQVLERRDADLSERQRRAAADPAYLGSLARRLGFVLHTERVIVPTNPTAPATTQPTEGSR
ncbi:MAG TPA: cell division protein FtsB [Deinococcales bacterium]|nr:cell division protein FtsB [Deinococcales bacterium]